MPSKDQKNHDQYLSIFETVLDSQRQLLGDKVALKYARKTSLEINPDGELTGFYGDGESVLEILVQQYEDVWGEEVADRKIGRELKAELPEEQHHLLTEDLRQVEPRRGAISQLKQKILG